MNIEDFVADSLTQICKGIIKAQENTKSLGTCISPRMRSDSFVSNPDDVHTYASKVSFDIAVEVVQSSEQTQGKPKFSVEIAGVSASLGEGAKKEDSNINRDAIRVQFDIPVCWPVAQFIDKKVKS